MQSPTRERVLVKISGGSLQGNSSLPHDEKALDTVAQQLIELHAHADVGVVIGGGNIWRGSFADGVGIDMRQAHTVGMAATVINAALLSMRLKLHKQAARVLSAIPTSADLAQPITIQAIENAFNEKAILIFAGGTGAPFFTTDTGAALRAVQIGASTILAGKDGIDGVYDADPKTHPNARFIAHLSMADALAQKLGVMDATAFAMCQANKLRILVFNATAPQALMNAYLRKGKFTLVEP